MEIGQCNERMFVFVLFRKGYILEQDTICLDLRRKKYMQLPRGLRGSSQRHLSNCSIEITVICGYSQKKSWKLKTYREIQIQRKEQDYNFWEILLHVIKRYNDLLQMDIYNSNS